MKTIYRFPINSCDGINVVSMPSDSTAVSCGIANDQISIWAEVDTESEPVDKTFCVFGTGADMSSMLENSRTKFIGTVCKSNMYAFHVYEVDVKE